MNNFKALTAIAIAILTSGCVSVTVEQEFHPDGTSDIAFVAEVLNGFFVLIGDVFRFFEFLVV